MSDAHVDIASIDPNDRTAEERFLFSARKAIESQGWVCDEEFNEEAMCYLVITKDDQRIGRGMFDRLYCWSEAYEKVTGQPWISLVNSGEES